MDSLRKPLLLAALALILLTVLVEVSSVAFLGPATPLAGDYGDLESPGLGMQPRVAYRAPGRG